MIRASRRAHDIITIALVLLAPAAMVWMIMSGDQSRDSASLDAPRWMKHTFFPALGCLAAWLLLVRRRPITHEQRERLKETTDVTVVPAPVRIGAWLLAAVMALYAGHMVVSGFMDAYQNQEVAGTIGGMFIALIVIGSLTYAVCRGVTWARGVALAFLWWLIMTVGGAWGVLAIGPWTDVPSPFPGLSYGWQWAIAVGALGALIASYMLLTRTDVAFWYVYTRLKRDQHLRHRRRAPGSALTGAAPESPEFEVAPVLAAFEAAADVHEAASEQRATIATSDELAALQAVTAQPRAEAAYAPPVQDRITVPRRVHDAMTAVIVLLTAGALELMLLGCREAWPHALPWWLRYVFWPVAAWLGGWLLFVRREPISREQQEALKESVDVAVVPRAVRAAVGMLWLWMLVLVVVFMFRDRQTMANTTRSYLIMSWVSLGMVLVLLAGFGVGLWRGMALWRHVVLLVLWSLVVGIGGVAVGLGVGEWPDGLVGQSLALQWAGLGVVLLLAGVMYIVLTRPSVWVWFNLVAIHREVRSDETPDFMDLAGVPATDIATDPDELA